MAPMASRFVAAEPPASPRHLEDALDAWLASVMPSLDVARRRAVARRLGWQGRRVPTLQEAGDEVGLTRERIRQLQLKTLGRLRRSKSPPFRELFDRAVLSLTIDGSPVTPNVRLAEAGLTRDILPVSGVRLLWELLGQAGSFDGYMRQLEPTLIQAADLSRRARALTRSVGVASIEWLSDELGHAVPPATVRQVLSYEPWPRFLDSVWFYDPTAPQGRVRLANIATKLAAACGPLEFRDVEDALDRQRRLGRLPRVPPIPVLKSYFAAHPDFVVTGDGRLTSSTELSPEAVLGATELILMQILQAAPDGFLDRAGFLREARAHGIDPNTFSVYTSYSVILDNPVVDVWVIRGQHVSPAVIAAQPKTRRPRTGSELWTEAGTLVVRRQLPEHYSVVVSVPRSFARFLAGRTFEAVDQSGRPVGNIVFNDEGTSWGYSRFLLQEQSNAGDTLEAEFHLVKGGTTLTLYRAGARG
jgi:hypothetical protein